LGNNTGPSPLGEYRPAAPDSTDVAAERLSAAPAPQTAPAGETPREQGDATRTFARLALDLGLPRDALSAVLLPFAHRFFLPLESIPLLRLRRQILSAKTRREAAALGAVAAAAKNLELNPAALRHYAAAIDPGIGEPAGEERRGKGDAPGEKPGAGALQKKAAALDQEDPLLYTLNRIPGADGRRWMVFPFSFSAGASAFKVSVRILLAANNRLDPAVDRLAVDIAGQKRRWLFMLDRPGRAGAETRLQTDPPLGEAAFRGLAAELEAALGDWGGKVIPAEDAGAALFPDAREGRGGQFQPGGLPSINKEV
jgi:hypothetical protein